MKKIIIIIIAAVVGIAACRKKDVASFHGAANIYFNLDPKDSILYTFALHPGKATDTAWVPVRISGDRINRDRVYAVKIIDSASTGIVNTQYQPLKDLYVLPAGAGVGYMPVILYNTDTMLFKRSFTLKLEMVPTGDFNSDVSERIYTKVVYSNRLEKPSWWNKSPGGAYSIVKYQLFRIAATPDDVPTGTYSQPVQLYFTAKLQSLLINADTWVINNPDKGYVLKDRGDGINKDFYEAQSPDKKFLYKKDTSSGKYYFIDENNQQIK
jgi:hypothetical protein